MPLRQVSKRCAENLLLSGKRDVTREPLARERRLEVKRLASTIVHYVENCYDVIYVTEVLSHRGILISLHLWSLAVCRAE